LTRIHPLLTLNLLILGISAGPVQSSFLDLSECPDHLPYDFKVMEIMNGGHGIFRSGTGTNFALRDLTGDGADERIRINELGVVSVSPRENFKITNWQFNLPVDFTWMNPCGLVEGFHDVEGDGVEDLICSARTEDNRTWRIWALDAVTGEVKTSVTLAAGPDLRPDGKWDGRYRVGCVGEVPTPRGMRRSFIILSCARLDLEPRGAIALDCLTGEEYWRYLVGPDPKVGDGLLADLDGDGEDEFVFQGIAVNNFKNGREYNGTSDDHAMVFALNLDGTLLWSHRVFKGTGGSLIRLGTDPGGNPEVVVASQMQKEMEGNVIRVLEGATGEILTEYSMPGQATGLCVVPSDGSQDIWWSGVGQLLKIPRGGRDPGKPEPVVRCQGRLNLERSEDLLPESGEELLVTDFQGNVYAISNDGAVLARHVHEPGLGPGPGGIEITRPAEGQKQILLYNRISDPVQVLSLVPARKSTVPGLWVAGLGVAAAGAAAGFWRRRRVSGPNLISRRDLRLQILGQLELSGHGAIGGLQTLRRLTWLIGGCAAKGAVSPEITTRLMNLERECRERAIPDMLAILDLARAGGLDERARLNAKEALALIDRHLESLAADGFAADQLLGLEGELRAAGEDAEKALQKLRREAAADFHADLRATVGRVLEAFGEDLATGGTDVRLPDPQHPSPSLRTDERELAFVLDNLVGNALRAMEGKEEATLTITWEVVDGLARCEVSDTGCGIVPDDWQRVMQPGYSTRKGGGLGLSRSRELLRKFEGDLAVKHSELGAGTTMVLSLPLSTELAAEDGSSHERN